MLGGGLSGIEETGTTVVLPVLGMQCYKLTEVVQFVQLHMYLAKGTRREYGYLD